MERYPFAGLDVTPQIEAGLNTLASFTPYLLFAAAVVAALAVVGLMVLHLFDPIPPQKKQPLVRRNALDHPVSSNRQVLPQLHYD